jgi:hypothetical protein
VYQRFLGRPRAPSCSPGAFPDPVGAKTRRLSSNRMLVELIENGIEAEKRKQQEFLELAERFREATDPEEVKRLGDKLGRMVFGS